MTTDQDKNHLIKADSKMNQTLELRQMLQNS